MISAAMCSLTDGSSTREIGPETGLVPPVKGVGSIGGDGLPGGMGVPSLLQGDNGGVVVSAERSDGGPVGLEARDVEVDEVYGGPRAIPVRGARVCPSVWVKAQRPVAWQTRATEAEVTTEGACRLWRG